MSPTPLRNAMTVDVEDYFHVAALARVIDRKDWDQLESRVERNTQVLLDLFAKHDVKATFFILGLVAKRHPSLVKRIAEQGHEVACHGMSHQLIYTQTRQEFERETRDAKALLEDQLGAPVRGYRAASWSITGRSLWALDVLAESGFDYDSSIFPIRHDRYGVPGASRWPGRLRTPEGGELVEFPPSTDELAGIRIPVAGGGYFRLLPYGFIRSGLERIGRRDGKPFNFYLHPWEVDPGQPRYRASWLSRFRHYTNLHRTESRLRQLVQEFRFTTMSQVLQDIGLLSPAEQSP